MGRKIVITSGKGGVGKTSITAGLGIALSHLGASVCMIDLDFGLNNLDLVLNLEDRVIYDLADCVSGKCRLKQALIPDRLKENLFYLPSGKISNEQIADKEQIVQIINKLSQVFDYCLLDSPAGLGKGFEIALSVSDEVIIVATSNISSLRDASKVKQIVISGGFKNLGLIINRLRGDLVATGKMLDENYISKALNINLLGVLPEIDEINVLSNIKSIYECGEYCKFAFDILAKNIHFNKHERLDYVSKYKGLIGSIKCKLKKNA